MGGPKPVLQADQTTSVDLAERFRQGIENMIVATCYSSRLPPEVVRHEFANAALRWGDQNFARPTAPKVLPAIEVENAEPELAMGTSPGTNGANGHP